MASIKDLAGQRSGQLTAIRPTKERKRGSVVWECLCDCGVTCFVSSYHFKSGDTRSCGCLKKACLEKYGEQAAKDLTGQKFGRLTAVGPTKKRQKGSVVWECRCTCGNITLVPAYHLTGGHSRSCGCARIESVRENVPELLETRTQVDGTIIDILKSKKKRKNNTSGHTGVIYRSDACKYVVVIGFQNKNYYLGMYENIADAIEVRKKAEALIHDEAIDFYEKWKEKAEADPEWAKQNPIQFHIVRDAECGYLVSCSPAL